jgi:hypothetical protein
VSTRDIGVHGFAFSELCDVTFRTSDFHSNHKSPLIGPDRVLVSKPEVYSYAIVLKNPCTVMLERGET